MRLLKEPLLHFILIGASFFAVYRIMNREAGTPDRVVISRGTKAQLSAEFYKDWNREPTSEELIYLTEDYIREELAYREGMAMGLDVGDVVIRQRIRQKLETWTEEGAVNAPPTDAELQQYLAEHADIFRESERFSFYQVFLTWAHREQAAGLLEALKAADAPYAQFGDPAPVDQHYTRVTFGEITRAFGLGFVDGFSELKMNEWSTPFESEFGIHLVYLQAKEPGRVPNLERIRPRVEFEWENAKRLQRLEALYTDLWERYDVRIDGVSTQ